MIYFVDEVEKLIRAGLRNPVRVSIKEKARERLIARHEEETQNTASRGSDVQRASSLLKNKNDSTGSEFQRTPSTLKNYYMIVESDQKLNQLVTFVQAHRKQKIMLFLSTCAAVDYFSKILPPLLRKSQVNKDSIYITEPLEANLK